MADTAPTLHPYERRLVDTGDDSEVLIMTWRADCPCAPHDHGQAVGTIHVVAGRFEERRYQVGTDGARVVETQVVAAPAVIAAPAGIIHDMRALDPGGITVHRYTPQITRMRVYDLSTRRVLVVADDCGAWIPGPEEAHQVVSVEPWPGCAATRTDEPNQRAAGGTRP